MAEKQSGGGLVIAGTLTCIVAVVLIGVGWLQQDAGASGDGFYVGGAALGVIGFFVAVAGRLRGSN
ncbi:MAG: hypothetical protein A2Y77_02880 [Planctomycetes bacterium RBG_13_62_9]|nr:MAG: hypothetical protein A2Y77_02880 [Planctomycetes bacterium RBG_13_62_9]